jgi:ribosomal protein S18 acetylase RimI-like enzyme
VGNTKGKNLEYNLAVQGIARAGHYGNQFVNIVYKGQWKSLLPLTAALGMKKMIIRKAFKSDFDSIADLHIESWQNSYSNVLPPEFLESKIIPSLKEHWRNIDISDDDVVLIAEKEKELIGFIAVWCHPIPFIDNLHVKHYHRSLNVGTALMNVAAETLIRKGKRTGYLWVFYNNDRAIRFYEKLGGVMKESALKNIFGHEVLSKRIAWSNLSTITMKHKI